MKKQGNVKSAYQNDGIDAIIYSVEVNRIRPNAAQPRTEFNINAITKLADSIRRYGLLQPLSVREIKNAVGRVKYELVAGERRLRACKMLGMSQVPCIIISADDGESAELALVENIIRENLNMFEQARAFSTLATKYCMTQEEIALKMASSQSAIANKLRLLRLTEQEQNDILSADLTERHARALLRITDPDLRKRALGYIICNKLNVSESEKYISGLIQSPAQAEAKREETPAYTPEKICSNIYKFISKIQRSADNRLIVNRRSDDKCVVITLTVRKGG
jgi:ParB family chromosome partitioning protein